MSLTIFEHVPDGPRLFIDESNHGTERLLIVAENTVHVCQDLKARAIKQSNNQTLRSEK